MTTTRKRRKRREIPRSTPDGRCCKCGSTKYGTGRQGQMFTLLEGVGRDGLEFTRIEEFYVDCADCGLYQRWSIRHYRPGDLEGS